MYGRMNPSISSMNSTWAMAYARRKPSTMRRRLFRSGRCVCEAPRALGSLRGCPSEILVQNALEPVASACGRLLHEKHASAAGISGALPLSLRPLRSGPKVQYGGATLLPRSRRSRAETHPCAGRQNGLAERWIGSCRREILDRRRGHMPLLSGEHGLSSEAGRGFESLAGCKDSRCLLEVPEKTERTSLGSLAWVYTHSAG
jgi:hypothetical protein